MQHDISLFQFETEEVEEYFELEIIEPEVKFDARNVLEKVVGFSSEMIMDDVDIRYIEKDGDMFMNPFDFFQSVQKWMYNLGMFSNLAFI